jgi:hypothetical protein
VDLDPRRFQHAFSLLRFEKKFSRFPATGQGRKEIFTAESAEDAEKTLSNQKAKNSVQRNLTYLPLLEPFASFGLFIYYFFLCGLCALCGEFP